MASIVKHVLKHIVLIPMLMALIACASEQTYSDLEVAGTVEAAVETAVEDHLEVLTPKVPKNQSTEASTTIIDQPSSVGKNTRSEELPNIEATVEAKVQEKLAEIAKITPTATPVPMDAQYLAILSKWDPQSRWGPEYREILYVQLVGQWLLSTGRQPLTFQPTFYDWLLSRGKDALEPIPWKDLSDSWALGSEIGSGNGAPHSLENIHITPALYWHLSNENPDIDTAMVGIILVRTYCGELIKGEAADGVIRLLTERYEKHKYATIMEKGNPASFLPKFDTTVATC